MTILRSKLGVILACLYLSAFVGYTALSGFEEDAFGIAGLLLGMPWSPLAAVVAGEVLQRVIDPALFHVWWPVLIWSITIAGMALNGALLMLFGQWVERLLSSYRSPYPDTWYDIT